MRRRWWTGVLGAMVAVGAVGDAAADARPRLFPTRLPFRPRMAMPSPNIAGAAIRTRGVPSCMYIHTIGRR